MRTRTLLVALVVTVFFVVGLPGSATAEHATIADGSPPTAQQVTDAGTGTGQAIYCPPTLSSGDFECPDCATGGPIICH